MGTTDKGLDYPEPTAYLRDGASAIRALAEDTDAALGGALFRATVGTEAIANATDDKLDLTMTAGDSPLFVNSGVNYIQYTGPDVVAIVTAQVTWEGDAAGTRKVTITLNDNDQASSRVTPDSQPITQTFSWLMVLTSGDKLGLVARQTAGHAVNVTAAKFRCALLGVAP